MKLYAPKFLVLLCLSIPTSHAQERVTVSDFVRAETDRYMHSRAAHRGLGKLNHSRQVARLDQQRVIRMNRDTLYSGAVFDLTSPVTISMPDSGGRYLSLQVINQNHHVKHVAYDAGNIVLTQEDVGTRYAYAIIRVLVDADDEADVQIANALQDKIRISQSDAGVADFPEWDQSSLLRLRNAIKVLGDSITSNRGVYGDEDEVDPILHLVGTAYGWGGLPVQHALYFGQVPEYNDGQTPHTLTFDEMPVDGFWSVSIYNRDGYFEHNELGAYVINDRNSTVNKDGTTTIHFGGDPGQINYLPITPGWNYTVRLYRPKALVLESGWEMPKANPVSARP